MYRLQMGREGTMADETQTTTIPAAPAAPQDDKHALLIAKHAELQSDMKTTKERLHQLASVFGVDLSKQTPEQIAQTRAAEQRDRERRASAIERSVTRTLVTSGRQVPESVLDLIMSGAIQSQAIKVDETGAVQGAKEYLDGILTALRADAPAAPPRPESPQVPRQPLPGPDDVEPAYQAVTKFSDLIAMGTQHTMTYAQKYPTRYEALKKAHFDAAKSPQRHIPPAAVGAR